MLVKACSLGFTKRLPLASAAFTFRPMDGEKTLISKIPLPMLSFSLNPYHKRVFKPNSVTGIKNKEIFNKDSSLRIFLPGNKTQQSVFRSASVDVTRFRRTPSFLVHLCFKMKMQN